MIASSEIPDSRLSQTWFLGKLSAIEPLQPSKSMSVLFGLEDSMVE